MDRGAGFGRLQLGLAALSSNCGFATLMDPHGGRPASAGFSWPRGAQVSLLTLMVGNFDEKSLALSAILTATARATAL